jgi:hypothetical protein
MTGPDGQHYEMQNLPNKEKAVEVMASIHGNLVKLYEYYKTNPERCRRSRRSLASSIAFPLTCSSRMTCTRLTPVLQREQGAEDRGLPSGQDEAASVPYHRREHGHVRDAPRDGTSR